MNADTARALLERVSGALTSLKSKGNLLDDIAWSRDVEEAFFDSKCEALPVPAYAVDRDALDDENGRLEKLAKSVEGDEPIPVFLRAAVLSAVDRNRLLLAAGTKAFGEISKEIYGGAHSTFYGLPTRNIDLADHLLARLQVYGWDDAKDKAAKKIGAEELAADLRARIEAHRPKLDIDVILDDRCSSKAIAGMTRVRLRSGATFEPWEAEGLYVHEVETHVFTAQNGANQELAPFLKAGGPRTTPTQEGLAVFAELHQHALATPRLERLAVRVKMVEMAEAGGTFIDLYRWLVERGSEDRFSFPRAGTAESLEDSLPSASARFSSTRAGTAESLEDSLPSASARDAFLDVARIFRGGLVEGGAPFTKDACYLAGLLHVYAFLSTFVRAGFRDEVEMLVAGRIALDDVVALAELRSMGLLARPKFRPGWLARWSTLLPYFSFASFMDAIDLAPVETHYKELIEIASAAHPSRR